MALLFAIIIGLRRINKTDILQYNGGRHRYFHKLYALGTVLPNLGPVTKDKLEAAMKPHVIAQAVLIGTYQKHK